MSMQASIPGGGGGITSPNILLLNVTLYWQNIWSTNKNNERNILPRPTPSPRSVASLPGMGHWLPLNRENKSTPMVMSENF